MRQRVQSVDFLRGATIMLMILVNTPGDWSHVYPILLHAPWDGLTLADFVFPFFLFIVGVSIAFVYHNKQISIAMIKKIGMRSLKLILLGLFLNFFLPYFPFFTEIASVRIPGVLQRIGIVFFIVSLLYVLLKPGQLLITAILILIGYWIWMVYIPIPGLGTPTLERAPHNWAAFIDYQFLKGHIWQPDYDPEGVLSTLPACVTTIIGAFIGRMIKNTISKKHIILLVTGSILVLLGYLWSIFFPVNKALWSSSFVLVTAGYATLLLAGLYYLMDHKKRSFGAVVSYVGANGLIIYFLSSLVAKSFYLITLNSGHSIHHYLFNTFFTYSFITLKFSSFVYACVVVGLYTLLGYILHKKGVFVKV